MVETARRWKVNESSKIVELPKGKVGPLAQLVEQRTFNPWVVGSSPTGPTLFVLIGIYQLGKPDELLLALAFKYLNPPICSVRYAMLRNIRLDLRGSVNARSGI